MATIGELLNHNDRGNSAVTRTVMPGTFRFAERWKRCAYWSNGEHIVADGVCRCGKRFLLLEIEEGA